MKKLLLLTALLLSGCASTPGGVPTTGDISNTAKEIQNYTRLFCSFVPTIGTIASILSAKAAMPVQVATDICAAVTTAPLAEGPGRRMDPRVHGVRIKGRFVS